LEISLIILGFSIGRLLMAKGHHQRWTRVASPWVGVARGWAMPPCGVASLWPLSGSRLVLVLRPGKIGVSKLVSSNSENISYVAFLKYKNNKK
jgi:hypothetical protein